jgi:hypothetical protein
VRADCDDEAKSFDAYEPKGGGRGTVEGAILEELPSYKPIRTRTSLEDIMRGCLTSLTESVKRVLAVFIAYSILHLRGTPWLHADRFKASNILFFKTASALPLKPYIHVGLRDCDHDTIGSSGGVAGMDTEIDPDNLPLHPYPELIMLVIVLMELYTKQPTRKLAERGGMVFDDWVNIDGNTRYAVAVAAFEFFKAEFPDKYRGSVDKCLGIQTSGSIEMTKIWTTKASNLSFTAISLDLWNMSWRVVLGTLFQLKPRRRCPGLGPQGLETTV